jgi:hypothetical protein
MERARVEPALSWAFGCHEAEIWQGLTHQLLQRFNIPTVVAGLVDRGFGDEGSVCEAKIVQQDAERLFADGSLPDLLVAIEFLAAAGLGVVAVNHLHMAQADGCIDVS